LKLRLNIIKIILIVLAVADLSMWLVANGSGHKIPNKTNGAFLIAFFVLLLLLGVLFGKRYFQINKRKTKKE
jgi:peptidoglycan/LPS O-acetylase OafA/YrhL